MDSTDDIVARLQQAVNGQTYPSESDEPFDVFVWQGSGTAHDQVAAHAAKGRNIEEVPVETFFAQLDDADEAPRYRQLQQLLTSTLKNVSIFRVGGGEVSVDIYLLGQTPTGSCAGLHTVSIET